MGSLTSRPRVTTGTQTVVTTTPTNTENTTPITPDTSSSTTTTNTASPASEEQRTQTANLLLRDRGRLGTILTGFRGLLSTTDQSTGRKTLLGE